MPKLTFVGDIMQHDAQNLSAFNQTLNSFSYDYWSDTLKTIFKQSDYLVGNLETTFSNTISGFPNFSSPFEFATFLKTSNFKMLTLANNHSLDYGLSGLAKTKAKLKQLKLNHVGTKFKPYDLVYVGGLKVLILNITFIPEKYKKYTELENPLANFEQLKANGMLDNINLIDADFKVVYIHEGTEYETEANNQQKELADYFVSNGYNLTIFSHPHVIQPSQQISKNQYVFYSLGNLIADQSTSKTLTKGGLIVEVDIKKSGIRSITTYPVWTDKTYGRGKITYKTDFLSDTKNDLAKVEFLDLYNEIIKL
jgi:poly-gamma-glutamate synthesis protein (capsule biosynthesis protein)